jgi:hypothetical protein
MSDVQYTTNIVLASDVANNGTFTAGYPQGTSQLTFTHGLAGKKSYIVVNYNDQLNVSDGKISISYDASVVTVTNLSGATLKAQSNITLGLDVVDDGRVAFIQFPIKLSKITTVGNVVTEFIPGLEGTIEDVQFVVTDPVVTASKTVTLNLEIDTTNVTGGGLTLTSAALTPLGKVVFGTLVTANNVLVRESKLSVESSAVTAFAEGEGVLIIRVRTPVRNY